MTDPTATPTGADKLPLAGVRVVEFTHMVMGPTCGMILADLGAEVIKVEPLAGDNTRRLLGSGAGFFGHVQPQQEEPGGRPRTRAAARSCCAWWPGPTCSARTSRAAPWTAWGWARRAAHAEPAPDLRLAQGLPARALRAPHRAGRSGADDGRPGLHDRARGPAAARRQQRQRHHGRHVRRHRRAGRAAQRDHGLHGRQRPARCRARCSRTTSSWWPSTCCSSR
jgi:hypothetical protein